MPRLHPDDVPVNAEILDAIYSLQKAKKIPLNKLATEIGLSRGAIGFWTRGESKSICRENWNKLYPHIAPYLPQGKYGIVDKLSREERAKFFASKESAVKPAVFRHGCSVPVLSQAAAAEVNTLVYPIAEYANDLDEVRTQYFPDARPGDFAIEVCGDSMLPYYPNKTVLLIRPNVRIPSNSPVIAVFANGEVVFKLYFERENGKEFLLTSINGSGKTYHFTLDTMGQIRALYRVITSMRNEEDIRESAEDPTRMVWEKFDNKGGL